MLVKLQEECPSPEIKRTPIISIAASRARLPDSFIEAEPLAKDCRLLAKQSFEGSYIHGFLDVCIEASQPGLSFRCAALSRVIDTVHARASPVPGVVYSFLVLQAGGDH